MPSQVPFSPCLRAAYLEQAVWWQETAHRWIKNGELATAHTCLDVDDYRVTCRKGHAFANATAHKYLMFGLGADMGAEPYG